MPDKFGRRYWDFVEKKRKGYTFDSLRPILTRYVKWIRKHLSESNIRVLDIGCGFGYFLRMCDEIDWETFGVDASDYAVRKAKEFTNAKLFVHNAEKGLRLFENEYFDLVVMTDVIEHLLSPYLVLKDIHRILKPHGKLVLTTANVNSIWRRILKLRRKERLWHGFCDYTHLYLFTPVSIKFLIERVGFRTLELKTPFHPLPVLVSDLLEHSGLGGQIWLAAEKSSTRALKLGREILGVSLFAEG